MAAARRLRLRQLADEGDSRAQRVLQVQLHPGSYFTVVQIGQNMVAILGGIVGEGALAPSIAGALQRVAEPRTADTLAFVLSFLVVTSLFILFADLLPKRLGLNDPERLAVRVVGPMRWWMVGLRRGRASPRFSLRQRLWLGGAGGPALAHVAEPGGRRGSRRTMSRPTAGCTGRPAVRSSRSARRTCPPASTASRPAPRWRAGPDPCTIPRPGGRRWSARRRCRR